MIAAEEQRHLMDGARPGEVPGGSGTVSVVARGDVDAHVILDRCRDVLGAVLENSGSEWPTVEEWRAILPGWFVAACGPEMSLEDAELWLVWWRALGPEGKALAETDSRWPLADWLYWVTPSERPWYWWDAEVTGDGGLRVIVEVPGWPTALGALDWLLRACGVREIVHED